MNKFIAISIVTLGLAAAFPAAAHADVTCQSGCSVDTDGTQGSMAPAIQGSMDEGSHVGGGSHPITSNACYVTDGDSGCDPGATDPQTISADSIMGPS